MPQNVTAVCCFYTMILHMRSKNTYHNVVQCSMFREAIVIELLFSSLFVPYLQLSFSLPIQ